MIDNDSPYFLPPQSIVSFSGGRTSGYMLWHILQAHGGELPPDRVVVFCNTGKEREETLEFVRDCSTKWGVQIRWLEYRFEVLDPGGPGNGATKNRHYSVEVSFNTASRKGEPFRMVIAARSFLPNPRMRFCTGELKIRTTNRFVRQDLGWDNYMNAIGLRYDEPKRVNDLMQKRVVTIEKTLFGDVRHTQRAVLRPSGETPRCPIYDAGDDLLDVLAFWKRQPFDLRLPVCEKTGKTLGGNCDLCFLKGAGNIVDAIRENPESADWWIETETLIKNRNQPETARFRVDRPPYAELRRIALGMADEPGWLPLDREGMSCGDMDCSCTD